MLLPPPQAPSVIDPTHQSVGDYWSNRRSASPNWWTNRLVIRHVNRLVCGTPHRDISQGVVELAGRAAGGDPFRRAVSVGCGSGAKELSLLRAGVAEHMTGFDLAAARIADARAAAREAGFSDRAEFVTGDAFTTCAPTSFDLVYWNNALHHMFNVDEALAWSRNVLTPGGLLLVDEYVGPDRLRFEGETLAFANAVRGLLPERLRAGAEPAFTPESFAPVAAKDPSEAADSARILPALRDQFEDIDIRPTGGVVYYLALNGLFGNFDMASSDDRALLGHLLELDRVYTAARPDATVYAVAIARR